MVPVAGTNALFFVLKNGAQFNPTVCCARKNWVYPHDCRLNWEDSMLLI